MRRRRCEVCHKTSDEWKKVNGQVVCPRCQGNSRAERCTHTRRTAHLEESQVYTTCDWCGRRFA